MNEVESGVIETFDLGDPDDLFEPPTQESLLPAEEDSMFGAGNLFLTESAGVNAPQHQHQHKQKPAHHEETVEATGVVSPRKTFGGKVPRDLSRKDPVPAVTAETKTVEEPDSCSESEWASQSEPEPEPQPEPEPEPKKAPKAKTTKKAKMSKGSSASFAQVDIKGKRATVEGLRNCDPEYETLAFGIKTLPLKHESPYITLVFPKDGPALSHLEKDHRLVIPNWDSGDATITGVYVPKKGFHQLPEPLKEELGKLGFYVREHVPRVDHGDAIPGKPTSGQDHTGPTPQKDEMHSTTASSQNKPKPKSKDLEEAAPSHKRGTKRTATEAKSKPKPKSKSKSKVATPPEFVDIAPASDSDSDSEMDSDFEEPPIGQGLFVQSPCFSSDSDSGSDEDSGSSDDEEEEEEKVAKAPPKKRARMPDSHGEWSATAVALARLPSEKRREFAQSIRVTTPTGVDIPLGVLLRRFVIPSDSALTSIKRETRRIPDGDVDNVADMIFALDQSASVPKSSDINDVYAMFK